jgi:hypothetical protein
LAFLRFSRDKRGYENFYLVETSTNRRGKTRARVLYWFRTPPGVKVGREPFDEEIRRALEAQNPTVVFDWRKISETPIPSPDAEKWRERRRLERTERARRRDVVPEPEEREPSEIEAQSEEGLRSGEFPDDSLSSDEGGEEDSVAGDATDDRIESESPAAVPVADLADLSEAPTASAAGSSDLAAIPGQGRASRRRRRRRRRGGQRGPERPRDVALEAADGHAESKDPLPENGTADSGKSDDSNEV